MDDKRKHEIWRDAEGLTGLCFAGDAGDDFRKLQESGAILIHAFYAGSHFEAMTYYYEFMGWGIYEPLYEEDKQPYGQNNFKQ